jgi:hypothetical protein
MLPQHIFDAYAHDASMRTPSDLTFCRNLRLSLTGLTQLCISIQLPPFSCKCLQLGLLSMDCMSCFQARSEQVFLQFLLLDFSSLLSFLQVCVPLAAVGKLTCCMSASIAYLVGGNIDLVSYSLWPGNRTWVGWSVSNRFWARSTSITCMYVKQYAHNKQNVFSLVD